MDALSLYVAAPSGDFTPANVWACGRCKTVAATQDQAERCCRCHICHEPIMDINRRGMGTAHPECSARRSAEERAQQLQQATLVPPGDGWVYDATGGGRFYATLAECVENLADDEDVPPPMWPEFVHPCRRMDFSSLDPTDELLECSLGEYCCEDESVRELLDRMHGIRELEAALKAFEAANTDLHVYYPVMTEKIRVPNPYDTGEWSPNACAWIQPNGTCDHEDFRWQACPETSCLCRGPRTAGEPV